MKSTIRLRERILITLITLMVARLGIFIPIPNIDYNSFYNSLGQNALINFLNMFSGGGFYSIGIFALGIVPYINSSIIMQILTKIVPELENLQKEEGESGKQKITQITRYLTLLWAILQSTGISIWIKPYVFYWNESFLLDSILTLTTGSMIIMWFSEVITEYGIGNGASLIIFQNIVSGVPSSLLNYINTIHSREAIIQLSCIVLFFILILVVSILMQEGKRKVIIISARQLGKIKELNPKSYIPLKLNQGGVMPLIFASAAMALPPYLSQIVENTNLQNIFCLVSPGNLLYLPLYCCLITIFSYFYSSLILNPEDIAKNLKKMGASIPNTRPGANTIIYLEEVLNKLTLIGASFLFMLAIVPSIISYTTKVNSLKGLGVTSLLILVSVAIDTAKQIQTYIISQQYDNMMK